MSNDAGIVDIEWGTNDNLFSISWTERGGQRVAQPSRKGFGTTVIVPAARMSVDCDVDLR